MIVDAHIHYWQPHLPDRPWDPAGVDLGRPLAVEELLADAAAAGVDQVVQVTPTIMGYDNRYSFEGAQLHPDRIAGVFARFDPVAPAMAERFAELRAQPHFLGVRLTLMKPPWDTWLADGTLEPFFDEAGRAGTPVAIYAPRQAHAILQAAHRHPATRLLVDHMAVAHQDREPFARWNDTLALAGAPNVWMKADYFPEVAGAPYPFAPIHRYVRDLYDAFGPQRLIWGSNYPPSGSAAPYKASVDLFVNEFPFIDDAGRAAILGGTLLDVLAAVPKAGAATSG
jgi:predicted TIM-barrel fold metal-dependent hydrolase